MDTPKSLVNPIALKNCSVRCSSVSAVVLDVSFVRLVTEDSPDWTPLLEQEFLELEISLERHVFYAKGGFQKRGNGWIRFSLDHILPSSRAHLRSFLSPKKVGESIVEDWRTDSIRHYHGLNESELWFDPSGSVLFSYLDSADYEYQFFIRVRESSQTLQVGRLTREQYMALSHLDGEITAPFLPEKEVYSRLGECRDIITNIRPTGPAEYELKQKLLKVVSEFLYSTGHKFDSPLPIGAARSPVVES